MPHCTTLRRRSRSQMLSPSPSCGPSVTRLSPCWRECNGIASRRSLEGTDKLTRGHAPTPLTLALVAPCLDCDDHRHLSSCWRRTTPFAARRWSTCQRRDETVQIHASGATIRQRPRRRLEPLQPGPPLGSSGSLQDAASRRVCVMGLGSGDLTNIRRRKTTAAES